jgi:hypothetical protein
MTLSEVIHHLVDNSQAFDAAGKVEAHKAISAEFNDEERHSSVPSPEEEKAADDERAAKVAELKAQLAALEDEPAPEPEPEPEK